MANRPSQVFRWGGRVIQQSRLARYKRCCTDRLNADTRPLWVKIGIMQADAVTASLGGTSDWRQEATLLNHRIGAGDKSAVFAVLNRRAIRAQ